MYKHKNQSSDRAGMIEHAPGLIDDLAMRGTLLLLF